jgi:hypothetical protein
MRHKSDLNVGGESDRSCTTFEVPEQMSRRVAEEGGRSQGEQRSQESSSVFVNRAVEMTDLMESLESQYQASHPFHRSLEISQKTRDSTHFHSSGVGCFTGTKGTKNQNKPQGRLHKILDTARSRRPESQARSGASRSRRISQCRTEARNRNLT